MSARGGRETAAGIALSLVAAAVPAWSYRFHAQSLPLREALQQKTRSAAQIEADWNLYSGIERENRFLLSLSPARGLAGELRANLLQEAAAVVDS